MKPLLVLVAAFFSVVLISGYSIGDWNFLFAGNLAMCLMLFLTASGHVLFTKGMVLMIPPVIPFKKWLVYLTGIAEVILGLGLLFHSTRTLFGWMLIVFFIILLPANIYGALKHLNMEKAQYDGPGLQYLWFRVPLQMLFIGWTIYFSIHHI